MSANAPLTGRLVLDATSRGTQMAGRVLADLGADVVLVEPSEGTPTRPRPDSPPEQADQFAFWNLNKSSLVVELDDPAGAALVREACAAADVVLVDVDGSRRSSSMQRLADMLAEACTPPEKLITIRDFSPGGTGAAANGSDLTATAMSGLLGINGAPGQEPCRPPEYQGEYVAGIWAALSAVLVMREADRGNPLGGRLTVVTQQVLAMLEQMIRSWLFDGVVIERAGSQHKRVCPGRIFETRDGLVHLYVNRAHWRRFLDFWEGHPAFLEGEEWADNDYRRANCEVLSQHVAEWVRTWDTAAFVSEAQARGVTTLPVNRPQDVLADPHLRERGLFQRVKSDAHEGEVKVQPFPLRVDGSYPAVAAPPSLGEGGQAVLESHRVAAAPSPSVASGAGGQVTSPGAAAPGDLSAAATWKPLEGIRVLALTTGIAGPLAGRILAQLGAEVLKIESRAGHIDSFRYFGPENASAEVRVSDDGQPVDPLDAAPRFIEHNLGVKSVAINLKDDEGLAAFYRLVDTADVLIENFRPKVLERLRIGPDTLRERNPRLVMVRLPGLGSTGPSSAYGSWGPLLCSYSGLTYLWNHSSDNVVGTQGALPDFVAAIVTPLVVAATRAGRQDAAGAIELAQSELATFMIGASMLGASSGRPVEPQGNRRGNAFLEEVFRCAGDDRWLGVRIGTADQFGRVRDLLDPDAAGAPTGGDTATEREQARDLLSRWCAATEATTAMELLESAGVSAGVVQTNKEVAECPRLPAERFVEWLPHPGVGPMPVPSLPVEMDGQNIGLREPAPRLGEHTREVLEPLMSGGDVSVARMTEPGGPLW